MSIDTKLVARLQALLNKTTANGCTEAEAQAAMAAVARIANQNNLDLAAITVTDHKASRFETDRANLRDERCDKRQSQHEAIAGILASCFDVHVIWLGGHNAWRMEIALIGEKTDVAIGSYCWTWLCATFPSLYRAFQKERGPLHNRSANEASRRGYFEGLAAGIVTANRRQREEAKASAQGDSFALVLVKKEEAAQARVAEEFPTLKTFSFKAKLTDYGAWNKGLEKGRTIKLNGGLTGGTKSEELL